MTLRFRSTMAGVSLLAALGCFGGIAVGWYSFTELRAHQVHT